MIKEIVLCGGIWAATATSVALVRYPQLIEESLEEGEIETLDPEDFTSEEGKEQFASKYPSYFASTKESNRSFWEERFEKRKNKDNGKIEVNTGSGSKLEIFSAWNESEEKNEERLSLSDFCRDGYSAKSVFSDHDEWNFESSSRPYVGIAKSIFWSLCSVFGSKPETLCDIYDDKGNSSYDVSTIGLEIHKSLVRTDVSHVFWVIREQEWRAIEVKDSTYFGDEKKKNSSIKDLCDKAYKQKASIVDNEDMPKSEAAAKYCRLEWTWD